MASATFALKAVDETRAAFAAVQNSLGKLNATSASVGKTLKTMMMGGLSKSFLRTLDSMGDKLDKLITEGEEIGFGQSVEDALRLKRAIDGFFKLLLVIPSLIAKGSMAMVDLVKGSSEAEIKAEALLLWQARYKKEIQASVDSMMEMEIEFMKLNASAEVNAQYAHEEARAYFEISQMQFARGKDLDKAMQNQAKGLAKILEEAKLRKEIKKNDEEAAAALAEATAERKKAEDVVSRIFSKQLSNEQQLSLLYRERMVYEDALKNIKGEGADVSKLRLNEEKKLKAVLDEIIKLEEQRRQFGMEFGSRIADSFEEAILSGNKLKEVIRSLAQDLLRMIFREQITKPMASGLGNFFANLFTGKATGGPVSGGTPYMVGERGPELFVPGSSGSIIPNHKMGGAGGGGSGVNITYNISSGVSKSELLPILENERKRLKAEIPDMVRRGGAYRAAFA